MSEYGHPGKPGRRGERGDKGMRGGTGGRGERGPRGPDLNEGRGYWRQVGVIPRWQLVAVYLAFAVIVAVGFGIQRGQSDAIQRSREDVTRQACVAQNARHDDAIRVWSRLTKTPPTGKRARDLEEAISSLVPVRDCEHQVAATKK
jgi:hypothetical protein